MTKSKSIRHDVTYSVTWCSSDGIILPRFNRVSLLINSKKIIIFSSKETDDGNKDHNNFAVTGKCNLFQIENWFIWYILVVLLLPANHFINGTVKKKFVFQSITKESYELADSFSLSLTPILPNSSIIESKNNSLYIFAWGFVVIKFRL